VVLNPETNAVTDPGKVRVLREAIIVADYTAAVSAFSVASCLMMVMIIIIIIWDPICEIYE
jgi:hypothetical protein